MNISLRCRDVTLVSFSWTYRLQDNLKVPLSWFHNCFLTDFHKIFMSANSSKDIRTVLDTFFMLLKAGSHDFRYRVYTFKKQWRKITTSSVHNVYNLDEDRDATIACPARARTVGTIAEKHHYLNLCRLFFTSLHLD